MKLQLRLSSSLVLFSLILILISSCQGVENQTANHAAISEKKITREPAILPDDATLIMIDTIRKAHAKVNHENINYYLNEKRADFFLRMMEVQTGPERINSMFGYGQELINIGELEKAITIFENMREQLSSLGEEKDLEVLKATLKVLSIAYFRKTEVENCLQNHTDESCIIPISKKAVHSYNEGSIKCVAVLEELLKLDPSDKEAQYLLNIAHMTLGSYPRSVSKDFRIPKKFFEAGDDFPRFEEVAMHLGVAGSSLAGGTCVEDFNNDGYLDIIASSWGFTDQIKYYENDQNGGYIDRSLSSGMQGVSGGLNLRHADYNNDGYVDFLILRGAWFFGEGKIPNSLMRNNGDGTFTDVSIESGLYSEYPTQSAEWADFNLDGHLDLFIANEANENFPVFSELMINQGDGTFKNEIQSSGISTRGFFKGVSCGDLNNDNYPDLYISNLGAQNVLFINTSASGQIGFKRIEGQTGTTNPIISFPTWMFDYNNDGHNDIFVSGYSDLEHSGPQLFMENLEGALHTNRPYLYRNNGNGSFTEVSAELGLNQAMSGMGSNFGDLDNDGFLDFYLGTGEADLKSVVPNRMYLNKGGKSFEDVSFSGGFSHIQKGSAVGFGDLDNDGDQDIYAVMGGFFEGDAFQNILYENPLGSENNWVNISLEGTSSNRSAIGARILLYVIDGTEERKIYHTVNTGSSFGGNSLAAEIGVGKAKIITQLTVFWPNKERTKLSFNNVAINKFYKIKEGVNSIEERMIEARPFAKTELE